MIPIEITIHILVFAIWNRLVPIQSCLSLNRNIKQRLLDISLWKRYCPKWNITSSDELNAVLNGFIKLEHESTTMIKFILQRCFDKRSFIMDMNSESIQMYCMNNEHLVFHLQMKVSSLKTESTVCIRNEMMWCILKDVSGSVPVFIKRTMDWVNVYWRSNGTMQRCGTIATEQKDASLEKLCIKYHSTKNRVSSIVGRLNHTDLDGLEQFCYKEWNEFLSGKFAKGIF